MVLDIFESIVPNEVMFHLNTLNNLLYDYHTTFMTDLSTDSALLYLTDKIRSNMPEGQLTGIVLMEIQNAFDNVKHNIVLE